MNHPDLMRAPLWHTMVDAAGLVTASGEVGETIFGQMTALAARHGAINLGQGAPGTPPPGVLLDAVTHAMRTGSNQYAPGQGVPALLEAVTQQQARDYGRQVSVAEVLITVGATEALTASILALVPAGGQLVVFEPFYDSYAAATAAAGATLVTVPILPDGNGGVEPDWDAFAAAVSDETSAVLVNSPHNPTGHVFDAAALRRIHAQAQAHDAWVITDEVYEYLVFDQVRHQPLATVVDDPSNVVTIASAGKSLNVTGWKIGWLIAAPEVRAAIQAVKQFMSFTSGTPLQTAIAQILVDHPQEMTAVRDSLVARRDVLLPALTSVPGARVLHPSAGYFALLDYSALSGRDAFELNEVLSAEAGLTGIPVAGLCRAGSPTAEVYRSTIRYSFCKAPAEVDEAVERFGALAQRVARGEISL